MKSILTGFPKVGCIYVLGCFPCEPKSRIWSLASHWLLEITVPGSLSVIIQFKYVRSWGGGGTQTTMNQPSVWSPCSVILCCPVWLGEGVAECAHRTFWEWVGTGQDALAVIFQHCEGQRGGSRALSCAGQQLLTLVGFVSWGWGSVFWEGVCSR